jgi:hypothetical protein
MGRVLKIRLGDEDRAELDCPEWLEFDRDVLEDTRAGELHDLEMEMDFTFSQIFAAMPTRSARVHRAVAWLALRQSGSKVGWADFDPKILKAEFRRGDGEPQDDDPPAGGPSPDGPTDGGSPDGSDDSPSDDDSPA